MDAEKALNRRSLGARGEDIAARYLSGKGMRIVARNWRRGREGEIDLVCLDGKEVVFVEVKTRAGGTFGDPVEQISSFKARQLRRLAQLFLAERGRPEAPHRIDVIGIAVSGGRATLRHLRSAIEDE